ncbi:MAG: hypothetical protein ACK4VW_00120 [Anaerolineales bacterium]
MVIQDVEDLIKQLHRHPEWRDALRREILTEELLSLPQIVRELAEAQKRTEERIGELAEAQKRTEERIGELAEAQKRTEQRLDELAEAQKRTEERIGELAEAQKRTEERLEALTKRVDELAEAQKRTEQRLDELAEAQKRTEQRVDELTQAVTKLTARVDQITYELNKLRGDNKERYYREHAGAFFGSILRRARALSDAEITMLVEDALDAGKLSEEERNDLLLSDLIVRGRDRQTHEEIHLLVEVSIGIGRGDVERAARRAALLSRLFPTRPVVAGEGINAEAIIRCRELGVWQVLDGAVIAPQAP